MKVSASVVTAPPIQKQSRLLFIDMFRGLVTLIMIEGHVSNATILKSIQKTEGFHYLDLLNGMIAPSFIFIAGFAFTLALERKWDDFMHGRKALILQIRRLLFIMAVGYWLHLPLWSFRGMLRLSREAMVYVLRVDVLQLISISLLIILGLALLIRNKKALMTTLLVLAIGNVFATPFVYDLEPGKYLPYPIAAYVNTKTGSLFPLFAWSAYAMLGTFFSWIYLKAKEAGKESKFFLILAIGGLIMVLGGFALFYVPWQYHTYIDSAKSSPRAFMLRLGFVLFTLSATWFYEQKRKPTRSYLNIVGQESLFVYGLHLMIVYGSVFTSRSIARDIGQALTYLPSFAISAILISLMVGAALAWHWLKAHRPLVAKTLFYTLTIIYFLRFFLK